MVSQHHELTWRCTSAADPSPQRLVRNVPSFAAAQAKGVYDAALGRVQPDRDAPVEFHQLSAELEDKLGRAEVIDTSKLSGNTVKFGATVTLEDEDSGDKVKYMIVGEHEANVREGKISIASPIARALIGKGKGDSAEVTTPRGSRSYEILKIEYK